MADGGLADGAALGEVARADGVIAGGQLTDDRKPDRVGHGLQQLDLGIGGFHAAIISTDVNICGVTRVRRASRSGR